MLLMMIMLMIRVLKIQLQILISGVKGTMDEGDDTLEQIYQKICQSQLGEAELNKFQNVTELTTVTTTFSKIWDTGY